MSDQQQAQAEYYFGYGVGPNNFPALEAVKTWTEGDERRFATFTVGEYGMYEEAAVDERELYDVQHRQGLQAAMRLAERMAVAGGYLDPDREDLRLFQEGPPDPFESLAQRLEGEVNPYWNTEGEYLDASEAETSAWKLDTLPVNTPEGEPLGYAVQMVSGPSVGGDAPPLPDEPVWMMDVAHFERAEQAAQFTESFGQYVVPGLLDGPDLAAEIARLDGLPAQQRLLQGPEMEDYLNGELTLTRDPAEWHPYNPNAEREARERVEGVPQPQVVMEPELEL